MRGSLSSTDLSNPKQGLPIVQPRLPINPLFSKRPDTSFNPPLQNPDIIRKALVRVVDQDYYEAKPAEGIALNAASYSKKRLIMKNKHKFPSDFFNSTKRNSFTGPDDSFNRRQDLNMVQDTGSKLTNPEALKDTDSSFQTLFGFSHSDHRLTHETPKFSAEAFSNVHGNEIRLVKTKSNNDHLIKDNNNLSNAIDSIHKLDLARLKSVFLPNSRTLGSLTERITGSNEQVLKKVNISGKKLTDDISIGSPEVYSDVDRNFPQDLSSRLSSPEQKQRTNMQSDSTNKSVKTAPEKKKRTVTNKMLTDIGLLRKRVEDSSKEIQSALPRIKSSVEVLDQSATSAKTRLGGLQSQNYFRYDDLGLRNFEVKNKQRETSEEKKGSLDSSPLPDVHRKDSFGSSMKKIVPYQIVTQVSSTTIKHETTSIYSSDQEDRSSSPGRKKHSSLDNKIERFYGASNLKCKDPKKNEVEREKTKSRGHKRYSSMDIDYILMRNSKKKETITTTESKTITAERQSRGSKDKRSKEHKKHSSMEIQKDLVEIYKLLNNNGGSRSKTANKKEGREKLKNSGLKRQSTINDSIRTLNRDTITSEGIRRGKVDQEGEELIPDKTQSQNTEGNATVNENFLGVSPFEVRMRGFTFAKMDFDGGTIAETTNPK